MSDDIEDDEGHDPRIWGRPSRGISSLESQLAEAKKHAELLARELRVTHGEKNEARSKLEQAEAALAKDHAEARNWVKSLRVDIGVWKGKAEQAERERDDAKANMFEADRQLNEARAKLERCVGRAGTGSKGLPGPQGRLSLAPRWTRVQRRMHLESHQGRPRRLP